MSGGYYHYIILYYTTHKVTPNGQRRREPRRSAIYLSDLDLSYLLTDTVCTPAVDRYIIHRIDSLAPSVISSYVVCMSINSQGLQVAKSERDAIGAHVYT